MNIDLNKTNKSDYYKQEDREGEGAREEEHDLQ